MFVCGLMDVKTNQKWIIRTRRAMMKSISRILLVCPLNLVGHVEETQEEQVERLIGELQDENEDVRWNAVEVLGQIGSLDAVPALIQVLQMRMFVGIRQRH